MKPRFIYFDLGNVLLNFDHHRGARQMAGVAGCSVDAVWRAVFAGDLEHAYERGDLSTREFYEAFCRQTGTRPDYDALLHAAADIFELNVAVVPIVAALRSSGQRLGILSNTNEVHWDFIARGRYTIVRELFDVHALSFRMRSMKPDVAAYHAAADLAGTPPQDIFFVDDRPENIAGALHAGFNAVHFSGSVALSEALRRAGLRFRL